MRKIHQRVFAGLAAVLALSGCWSRTEPKNLSLLNSVLFDVQDDGNYLLVKEIMKLSGETGSKQPGQNNTVVKIDCVGRTVAEAARDEFNGKILFGGLLKTRFFTEKMARKGIVPILDFITRDPLADEMTYMAVIKDDDPKRIYQSMVGLSDMAGDHVEQLAATQPKLTGKSVFPRTLDFIKAYYADGKEPVAGIVTLEKNNEKPGGQNNSESGKNDDDEKKYLFRYEGLAVFKDDKLVGYLDGVEARAYNFVVNDIESPVISSPDIMTTAKVIKSKVKIKTAFENNRAIVDIKLKVGLTILEENQDVHLNSPEESKRLARQFAAQLEEEISRTIRKVQKLYQSDIFGFGVVMHAQNPEAWKAIKSYWNDFFADADVRVQAEASVALTGETQYPFAKVD